MNAESCGEKKNMQHVVSTVLTYVGAIRCDRTETKRKKKIRRKKEDAQNSKGREETNSCGGVLDYKWVDFKNRRMLGR